MQCSLGNVQVETQIRYGQCEHERQIRYGQCKYMYERRNTNPLWAVQIRKENPLWAMKNEKTTFSPTIPIIPAKCSILSGTYYSEKYASIICQTLLRKREVRLRYALSIHSVL